MKENVINKQDGLFWLSGVVLIGAFCLQYYDDFGNLLKRWASQDLSYCYLVPILFGYIIYTERRSLKKYVVRPSLSGLVFLVFSGWLYLAGRLGSMETLTYVAVWLAIVALALLLLGIKIVKALAFPFAILGFIVPLPPFLNRLFTFKLKLISSALSVDMMQAFGLSVFREGNIIDLGVTQLQVADACSGLRYVYPLLLMGFVMAYLYHKKWWERVLIIATVIPISIFCNTLRIAITGYLHISVSKAAAEGFFHGFSGWLIFMVSFVLLVLMSRLLKIARPKPANLKIVMTEKPNAAGKPKSFKLQNIKLSYLWAASVLFMTFWGLNAAFVSAQILPSRQSFASFPATIGGWQGEKAFVREDILNELWADDYVQIQFRHQKTGHLLLLFVPYYAYQGTGHTAHSPVSCLVGGGFAPLSRKTVPIRFPEPFGAGKIRQMVFEKNSLRVLANYWFQQRGRIIISEYANKWYLFRDSLLNRRSDGALVRIEMPLSQGQEVAAAQALMNSFAKELMKVLPRYVPG